MVGRNPPPPSCTGALIEVKAWQVFERWRWVAFFFFFLFFLFAPGNIRSLSLLPSLSFTRPPSLSLSAVTLWIAHGPRATLHFCRARVARYQTGRPMHMYRLMFLEWGIVYPWAKWINKCMKILKNFTRRHSPPRVSTRISGWRLAARRRAASEKRQKSPFITPMCHASHGRGWAASGPQSYILIITVSALPNLFAKYIIQI